MIQFYKKAIIIYKRSAKGCISLKLLYKLFICLVSVFCLGFIFDGFIVGTENSSKENKKIISSNVIYTNPNIDTKKGDLLSIIEITETTVDKTNSILGTSIAKAKRKPATYRYYTYDEGIVKSWSYLSKPYFIKSVARGETTEETRDVNANIGQKFAGLKGRFLKSAETTYGISIRLTTKVAFTGPDKGYRSRDFYYKKGRHKHKVRVEKVLKRSGFKGKLIEKKYGYVERGAVKHYSIDRKK